MRSRKGEVVDQLRVASVTQHERLQRARTVLASVEARQNVHNFASILDRREQGGVYHLDGHIETLVEALSNLLGEDRYAAVVEIPDIGWAGALDGGLAVDRIVSVTAEEGQLGRVAGTLLEGFSVVALGPVQMPSRYQKVLAARARKLNATILSMLPWIGVSAPFNLLSNEHWGVL